MARLMLSRSNRQAAIVLNRAVNLSGVQSARDAEPPRTPSAKTARGIIGVSPALCGAIPGSAGTGLARLATFTATQPKKVSRAQDSCNSCKGVMGEKKRALEKIKIPPPHAHALARTGFWFRWHAVMIEQ
jgi:hypothetical protein